jgi:PQQ-dependent dehydrogenase (methanol/ethanol family)
VGATVVKGGVLAVDGVLYVTAPDNVWALDAQDGRELWHFYWRTRGGTHIGNRGAAMWGNYLFFVTPDDYLISLDARTGRERWHKEIAPFSQQYFLTSAPVVVGNHVIVGTGNDLDSPGYLMAFDPETGEQQWRWYAVPMNAGDPGLETWKNLDAARNGGGHPWLPGSYDPETKLYIFGTGNPTPAYTSSARGEGLENLFTCAIVAVHVDTGKMAWYFQTSPHDTHDWDSAQTPILVDGTINGKPRKLVVTASRNGYYFTLDRLTGERLVTSKFSDTANWADGLNEKGQPRRIPAKDHHVAGALVSSNNGGATNWPPQAFSPDTGCSTCRAPRLTRCTTSRKPTRAARWGWAARTKWAWPRWAATSRQSTIGPGAPRGATASRPRRVTPAARPGCSSPPGNCCSAATCRGTSSRWIRPTARCCGTRASVACRTRRRRTASAAGSTCLWGRATRSTPSRCINDAGLIGPQPRLQGSLC